MKRDTIRSTVTISDPRCVQWLRARMGEQYQLSSAIERAINRMLDLEQEVAFLRGLVQNNAGGREIVPPVPPAPHDEYANIDPEPDADTGWNWTASEYDS